MKLVTMYGVNRKFGAPQYQFSLFSLGNPGKPDPMLEIDPRELSNVDAGIQALYILAKRQPGLTWGDLMRYSSKTMGRKWYERWIGDPAKDFAKWNSDIFGSAGDKLGQWGGQAIRLLTDEQVMEGISRYGAAYATGGQSEGLLGMLQGMGGGKGGPLEQLLSSIGISSKNQVQSASAGGLIEGIDNKILMVAGAGLILMFLLFK